MIYDLINPSDAITFAGDDPLVAAAALLLLGQGAYGLRGNGDGGDIPLMLFGAHEQWFASRGIADVPAYIGAHLREIADFLDTCLYGSIEDRRQFEAQTAAMPAAEAQTYRAKWDDEKRSSLNNIGARAKAIAANLRAKESHANRD